MEPEVATGLFVLGGVLVGAVASTASQVYLEKKREEREANRAKRQVAGELLHLQMMYRGLAAGTHWPFIEDADAYLPDSAWQEHRSRLLDEVDEDLADQLVMAYALLVVDRARLVTASEPVDKRLGSSEAAGLRESGHHLGRLRRRLGDGGGGWPDEIALQEWDSFVQWLDGLPEGDLRNDAVVSRVRQIAHELARLHPDDGGALLADINRRLEETNPD